MTQETPNNYCMDCLKLYKDCPYPKEKPPGRWCKDGVWVDDEPGEEDASQDNKE